MPPLSTALLAAAQQRVATHACTSSSLACAARSVSQLGTSSLLPRKAPHTVPALERAAHTLRTFSRSRRSESREHRAWHRGASGARGHLSPREGSIGICVSFAATFASDERRERRLCFRWPSTRSTRCLPLVEPRKAITACGVGPAAAAVAGGAPFAARSLLPCMTRVRQQGVPRPQRRLMRSGRRVRCRCASFRSGQRRRAYPFAGDDDV